MKKRMKDRPGLLDDAQRIAEAGRKGDKIIAHINPEEAALLKARGGSGSVNPRTGLLEFFSESDPMGSGADYGYGGDSTDASRAESENATNSMVADMNADIAGYGRDEGARAMAAARAGGIGGFNDSRTAWDRISDWAATGINNAKANPIATGINLAIPGVFGALNTVSGLFGGPSVGSMATAAGRSIGQTMGAMSEPGASPGNSPGDTPADSSGFTGSNPVQQPASANFAGQDPNKVAQEALRRAFMVNPQLLNTWNGNQFTAAGTAGKPNAYNQWQGNYLYRPPVFPGLIG